MFLGALLLALTSGEVAAQTIPNAAPLRAVVIVTRHGVRSPTSPNELTEYAAKTWPAWEVAPGELTPHGATLMTAFGAAYRARYATQGLVRSSGCPVPGAVYVWADVDERTKSTAAALLRGFAPGCGLTAHDTGATNDPLFHALPQAGHADALLASAALTGSLGGDPAALEPTFAREFAQLDSVMGCASASCMRISSVPTIVASSAKTGLASLAGGIDLAATAVEDLILAYSDGKSMASFSDSPLDASAILALSRLHTLKSELTTETPYVSRLQGSNLLFHLGTTIDELSDGRHGDTRVPATARFVAFVGHDTNLSTLAGMLRLHWLMRGYQLNDTPPGGALIFEIYAAQGAAEPFVRIFFTAQSLDEMRSLSGNAPQRVPVFVPGCPSLDCPLSRFDRIVASAVDRTFVVPW